jgi:hypothetical protein
MRPHLSQQILADLTRREPERDAHILRRAHMYNLIKIDNYIYKTINIIILMDTLDEEGKMLYDNYIKARNEWTTYIAPKISEYFTKKLNDANKKYYRFNYLFFKNVAEDITSVDVSNKPENLKKLYRKLSLLFHPDKFTPKDCDANDNLFKFIKKLYDEDDITKLSKINDDIDILLDYNSDMIDNYIMVLEGKTVVENKPVDIGDYDYTQSLQYIMFIKNEFNINHYYTPDELINHIENDYITDSEIAYYNRMKDDINIMIGLERRIAKKEKECHEVKAKLAKALKEQEQAEEELRILQEQLKNAELKLSADCECCHK